MRSPHDKLFVVCHLVKNIGDVPRTAEECRIPSHRVQHLKDEIIYEFGRFYWDTRTRFQRKNPPGIFKRWMRIESDLLTELALLRLFFREGRNAQIQKVITLLDTIIELESQMSLAPLRSVIIDITPLDRLIDRLPDVRANVRPDVQPSAPGLPYHEDTSQLAKVHHAMYSNRDKARAIRNLIVNLGDVQKTAEELQISERTIRRWKKTILHEGRLIYWDEDQPPFQVYQRYERIRVSMLIETERLLNRMSEVRALDAAEIATSVTRLTDRLAKIETIMERLGQYVIRIDTNILESLIITLEEKEREEQARQQQEQQAADTSEQAEATEQRRAHHRKKRQKRAPSRRKNPNTGR